jgi:hypothetical protein
MDGGQMSVKVINISEIDSSELFLTRQFMLGDDSGPWFVVDGDLYLGRYEDKFTADEHADTLNELDSSNMRNS